MGLIFNRNKDKDLTLADGQDMQSRYDKSYDQRTPEEIKKDFHKGEKYTLIVLWILFGILMIYIVKEIKGGWLIFLVGLNILMISSLIFYFTILIPYDVYLEINLSRDKTVDYYRMFCIPYHIRYQWDKKGGIPPPFVNAEDGSYMYPCKEIILKKKLIIFEHDARYTNSRWLVDKSMTIDIRNENMLLRDEVFRQQLCIEETVQRKLALLLERLNVRRQLFKDDLQFHRDYNQNAPAFKDGRSKISLLGDDPDDMSPDDRQRFNERLKKEQQMIQDLKAKNNKTDSNTDNREDSK